MNATIWRTREDRWCLIGGTLTDDGFFTFGGIWGVITKFKRPSTLAQFSDESAEGGTNYHYFEDKGKNWKLWKSICPEIAQFEFWDENRQRLGTYEQEKHLFDLEAKDETLLGKTQMLEEAGLDQIEVKTTKNTLFPSEFMGKNYKYGSFVVAMPAPLEVTLAYKEMFGKEEQLKKEETNEPSPTRPLQK